MIVLFPPAVLAVISNDATPGDVTYPVKRVLELGILKVASITPISKAWFTVERSNRRFKEVKVLLSKKSEEKVVVTSLNDLVSQTDAAAKDIFNISDKTQKKELANKLRQSIKQYKVTLQDEKQKLIASQTQNPGEPSQTSGTIPVPTNQSVPSGSVTAVPSLGVTRVPTSGPQPTTRTPSPTPTTIRSGPTPTRVLTPTPTQSGPAPTLPPVQTQPPESELPKEIDNTNDGLDDIDRRLETVSAFGRNNEPADELQSVPALDRQPISTEDPAQKTVPTFSPNEGSTQPSKIPTFNGVPYQLQLPTEVRTETPIPTQSVQAPVSESVECTACQADIVNFGGEGVNSWDISVIQICAGGPPLSQNGSYATACSKMDINGNDKIDSEEVDCARSKIGQICVQ